MANSKKKFLTNSKTNQRNRPTISNLVIDRAKVAVGDVAMAAAVAVAVAAIAVAAEVATVVVAAVADADLAVVVKAGIADHEAAVGDRAVGIAGLRVAAVDVVTKEPPRWFVGLFGCPRKLPMDMGMPTAS